MLPLRKPAARLFFLFHRGATALQSALPALGHDDLRSAFTTDVNFAELVSHF